MSAWIRHASLDDEFMRCYTVRVCCCILLLWRAWLLSRAVKVRPDRTIIYRWRTSSSVVLSLLVQICRCFPSRGPEGGERLSALPAGRLQERGGAAQTGTGQEPADEERRGQHTLSATQFSTAGSAGHAEGRGHTHTHRPTISLICYSCLLWTTFFLKWGRSGLTHEELVCHFVMTSST